MVFAVCRAASWNQRCSRPKQHRFMPLMSSSPVAAPPRHHHHWDQRHLVIAVSGIEQRHLAPSMLTPPSPEASLLYSIDVVVAWSATTSLSPDHIKRCKSQIKKSTMELLKILCWCPPFLGNSILRNLIRRKSYFLTWGGGTWREQSGLLFSA